MLMEPKTKVENCSSIPTYLSKQELTIYFWDSSLLIWENGKPYLDTPGSLPFDQKLTGEEDGSITPSYLLFSGPPMPKRQCLGLENRTFQERSPTIDTSSEKSPSEMLRPWKYQCYPWNTNDMPRYLVRPNLNDYPIIQSGTMQLNYSPMHPLPYQVDYSFNSGRNKWMSQIHPGTPKERNNPRVKKPLCS